MEHSVVGAESIKDDA